MQLFFSISREAAERVSTEVSMSVKARKKKSVSQIILHIVIIVLEICLLFPLAMGIFIALKDQVAFRQYPWIPTLPLWFSNIKTAFGMMGSYMWNTFIVALIAIPCMLFVSSISAFVFAKMKFPGKEIIYYGIIALMMVPGVLTLIPQYMLYNDLGLLNTRWVLIIPIVFSGSVGGVFLLRAFFGGFSDSVFEAASIDGCSTLQSYYYVCLPLSKAIMGTLAIQQIVGIWNDVVWPTITITNPKLWTISAGLYSQFVDTYANNVPVQFAGFLLAALPLVLLFVFANKYYIEGLTSSGIKL